MSTGEPGDSRHKLGELLGEGGMGSVYLAEDEELQRKVAVKCLLREHLDDETWCGRFFDEARILAGLDHPGVVPVYEVGTLDDGRHYYTMKPVSGETLKSLLDARDEKALKNPSSLLHLLDIFINVCQTMAAAHAEDTIHRDLKPENVMVDRFDAVYLMDWGVAKKIRRDGGEAGRTQVGQIIGTPSYMSPEQARGASMESDTQSDVFALGAMLYEILTGTAPFHAETVQDSLKGVLYHDPEEPRSKNPVVSKALSAICMKALDKDPFRRYRSAAELSADLRRYREHLPVTAARQGLLDRLKNWGRRKPALAGALASLSAAVLVVSLALAAETAIQRHFVGEAYEAINQWRTESESFEEEYRKRRADLAAETPGTRRYRELEFEVGHLREEMEIRDELMQGMSLGILTVAKFARGAPAQMVVRDVFWDRVNRLVREERFGAAQALLDFAISSHGRRNAFHITAEELEVLEALRDEVTAGMEEQVRADR